MGTMLVIVDSPAVRAFTHFIKVTKQVQAQELFTVRTIESFDIGILIRLARLNVLDRNPGLLSPGHKVTAKELGAVIDT